MVRALGLLLCTFIACSPAAAPTTRSSGDARHDHRGVHVKVHGSRGPGTPLAVFLEEEGPKTIGGAVAAALTRHGIAVAEVRYETASALPLVLDDLDADGARMVLVGYGAGADAAARLGLGGARTKSPIAGVLGLRGAYASINVTANPPRADAPPFILLSAADDDPGLAQAARRFARSLERAGVEHVESYLVPEHDATQIARYENEDALTALVVSFITKGPEPRSIDGPFGAKQIWGRSPPLSYEPLWTSTAAVVTHPIDLTFLSVLDELFDEFAFELAPWPLREYHALPLEKWLASRSDVGTGDHLIVTNVRGERLYLQRKDLAEHQPLLVIGIDDEKNLHRMFTRYRVNQTYSWKTSEGPMPLMIRTVGPFLFFPRGTPPHLRDTTLATFALTADSFRFVKDDPLASARKLGPDLLPTLTGNDGCLKCHVLRGMGARAHHVRAIDGKENGAFALPFEEYPSEVLRRFLFEQDAVAASFGVAPLRVPEPTAHALLTLVQKK